MSQSQLVSILYVCDSCRRIRQVDISMEEIELEGDLYKVTDAHGNHEAILYLNSLYALERVINNPPAPPGEPIIKGLKVIEEEEALQKPEPWSGENQIYIPTKDPTRIPVHDVHKQIVLAMDGNNTLADILEGLRPEWPDLTPEFLVRVVHNLKVRGWIREKSE